MKCPVCAEVNLVMADRQGIEIDYCPQCRGVWLDRGELDKMIERSASVVSGPSEARGATRDSGYQSRYPDNRHSEEDDNYRGDSRHKKRKGFLGDLFDFD